MEKWIRESEEKRGARIYEMDLADRASSVSRSLWVQHLYVDCMGEMVAVCGNCSLAFFRSLD